MPNPSVSEDTELPPRERDAKGILWDILLGVGNGLLLAGLWFLAAALGGAGGLDLGWRGCLIFPAVAIVVAVGAVVGGTLVGPWGALGGAAGTYLSIFAIYGMWVQFTVGWAEWWRSSTRGKR